MNPTWESDCGTVKLWLGDCLEVMATWPDESLPMIACDPPYGHGNHDGDWNDRLNAIRNVESKPIANDSNDDMRRVVDGMLHYAARLLDPDCCCCCCCCGGGGGPRPTFAWLASRMDADGLSFFHSCIWDKRNPGLGWRFRRQHEMVMVAHREGGRLRWADNSTAVPNVISAYPPRNRCHPNEKPVELMGTFVRHGSLRGDVVADPFMGSGTTGVAAVRLGRQFWGVELDPNYFEIAKTRIQDELRKTEFLEGKHSGPTQKALFAEA